jgi:hypothetical protein
VEGCADANADVRGEAGRRMEVVVEVGEQDLRVEFEIGNGPAAAVTSVLASLS